MSTDKRAQRDAMIPAATRIERLRDSRTWAGRAQPLGESLAGFRKELEAREKSVGPAERAWAEVIPHELAKHGTVVGVRRGTLTVRLPDNASRFACDRLLRAGAEIDIVKLCPRTVRRVKLVP